MSDENHPIFADLLPDGLKVGNITGLRISSGVSELRRSSGTSPVIFEEFSVVLLAPASGISYCGRHSCLTGRRYKHRTPIPQVCRNIERPRPYRECRLLHEQKRSDKTVLSLSLRYGHRRS